MPGFHSRLKRITRFGKFLFTLIVGGVALVTGAAFWQSRVGYTGFAAFVGVIALVVVALVGLPERVLNRLTGADTLAQDLGDLHLEGLLLRRDCPWVKDRNPLPLREWRHRYFDWNDRVQNRLLGTPWVSVYLSPIRGRQVFIGNPQYRRASDARTSIGDRLERIEQILRAIGGRP